MKNLIQGFLLLVITTAGLFLMVGCSGKGKIYRDRAEDYCEARSVPAIRIPQCLHPEPFSQEYHIPGE